MRSEIETGLLVPPVGEYDDHLLGSRTARATLLEYGDYQCPYCGKAQSMVHEVLQRMGKELQFAFRHFPITSLHPYAEKAAEAAEAAGAQGKFWEMHDILYQNQDMLEEEALLDYAGLIGLNVDLFGRALTSGQYREKVKRDFMTGIESGVNGTPSFFINGQFYDGPPEPDSLIQTLQLAVRE